MSQNHNLCLQTAKGKTHVIILQLQKEMILMNNCLVDQ